ncbi:Tftc-1 [Aphelenchoides fujianensis]|nr:Tftc-1 [Aphelenchoides fujianensis]
MGTMISEAFETGKSEEKTQEVVGAILNSLNPTTMTNSLMDCRSGRPHHAHPPGRLGRLHAQPDDHERLYFHHQYRRDLIEIVKKMVGGYTDDFKKCTLEEHPLGLLVLATAMCSDADIRMDVSKLEQMLPKDEEEGRDAEEEREEVERQTGAARTRSFEAATRHKAAAASGELAAERREDHDRLPAVRPDGHADHPRGARVLPLALLLRAPTGDWEAAKKKFVAELEKKDDRLGIFREKDAEQLFDLLKTAEWAGVPLEELQKKFELTVAQTAELVDLLAESEVAFPCGVAKRRVVGAPFCDSWFVKLDGRMIAIRPWCFSNGEINWVGLRWMAEALLLTVCFKPGITLAQLSSLYAFVLQPVCLEELIVFLEKIGCVVVDRKPLVTMKKLSPFSNERVVEVEECALPAVDALARFAAFFMDTTIQWRTLKHTPPADPKK